MKKKCLCGAGMMLLAVCILVCIAGYFQRKEELHNVERIYSQNGYLYYIERGNEHNFQIIRSNLQGQQADIISYPRYSSGNFRTVRQLFFDSQGEAYVLIEDTEAASFQKASCRVYRCDFGKRRLTETGYDLTDRLRQNYDIWVQGIREETIYYFEIQDTQRETGQVNLFSMAKEGEIRKLDSIFLESPYLKTQFFFSDRQLLLWMDYKGQLYAKELGSNSNVDIPGITDGMWGLKSLSDDDKSTAYVLDYEEDCVREINLKDQTSQPIYTAEEIRTKAEGFTFERLVNLQCTGEGFCAGIRNDRQDGIAAVCSYQNGEYREIKELTLTFSALCLKMLPFCAMMSALALLLGVSWCIHCRRQLKFVFMQLILVFAIGAVAANYAMQWWVGQTIQKQLEKNQTLELTILGERLSERIAKNIEMGSAGGSLGGDEWIADHETIGENSDAAGVEERMVYHYSVLEADGEGNLTINESMSEYAGVPAEWCFSDNRQENIYLAYESEKSVNLFDEDENGTWNHQFIPLKLSDDSVYGVLAVSVAGNLLNYRIWQYQRELGLLLFGLMAVLFLILMLSLYLKPLEKYKEWKKEREEEELEEEEEPEEELEENEAPKQAETAQAERTGDYREGDADEIPLENLVDKNLVSLETSEDGMELSDGLAESGTPTSIEVSESRDSIPPEILDERKEALSAHESQTSVETEELRYGSSLAISEDMPGNLETPEGYYKFIPEKLLELQGKGSIQQVQLGDGMTEDMTILALYAETDSNRNMRSAKEIYTSINEMLAVPVAAITRHYGVVEHFEDKGLSAFFLDGSKDALDAAIDVQKKMKQTDSDDSRETVIAISFGQVMAGIIGYEGRMEVAAISEQSDLTKALRLRGERYGARILLTQLAYQQIPDFEEDYHARYLGNIYLDGDGTSMQIYDVYDGDGEEHFQGKELTKSLFEQGVELFQEKKFYEARLTFIQVLKQYRKDKAAREYLYRCDKYYKLTDMTDADTALEHF